MNILFQSTFGAGQSHMTSISHHCRHIRRRCFGQTCGYKPNKFISLVIDEREKILTRLRCEKDLVEYWVWCWWGLKSYFPWMSSQRQLSFQTELANLSEATGYRCVVLHQRTWKWMAVRCISKNDKSRLDTIIKVVHPYLCLYIVIHMN